MPVTLEKKRQMYFIFYPDAQGTFCSNDSTLLLVNEVFKMKFLRHVFSNGNWKISYVTVSTCLVCPSSSHSNPWIYLKSKSVPTHCIPLWLILAAAWIVTKVILIEAAAFHQNKVCDAVLWVLTGQSCAHQLQSKVQKELSVLNFLGFICLCCFLCNFLEIP